MYGDLGATTANVLVGILSAIVDNIPVMFAVLTMFPAMDEGQWLLATLTAGVGVNAFYRFSGGCCTYKGQEKAPRGIYTFFGIHGRLHRDIYILWTFEKWLASGRIALGYAASQKYFCCPSSGLECQQNNKRIEHLFF